MTPKLIPECFKQEEILKRQRNPYKYMTVEQLQAADEFNAAVTGMIKASGR